MYKCTLLLLVVKWREYLLYSISISNILSPKWIFYAVALQNSTIPYSFLAYLVLPLIYLLPPTLSRNGSSILRQSFLPKCLTMLFSSLCIMLTDTKNPSLNAVEVTSFSRQGVLKRAWTLAGDRSMSRLLISNFQSAGGLLLKKWILSTFNFLLFKLKVKILPPKLITKIKEILWRIFRTNDY